MSEPQINTKDIVLRLDTKVDQLISDVGDLKVIAATVGTTVEALHDHEMRIRALEVVTAQSDGEKSFRRFLWPGIAAIAGAFDVLSRFHHP